ncbi:phosphotransferase [Primorskyibacter aestuariivivens]|uniref:aminoglycoside phosphotransferase family protein n=1 Tax=Primorskyibacter aestuariivivens TaxID=1888912 RepID=UPI002301A5E8|nr:phosphotransferase [Primorskyibacter aestuariivivens]MDA7427645.1 phosphotransferase [Primorskyibacter aestuariivivens]
MTRDAQIAGFLAEAGHGTARRVPLAGDASARRYERIVTDIGDSLILMDADPATGEDTRAFLDIRAHLFRYGFSAPAVFAEDTQAGLLLLEDFGDDVFARVMDRDPSRERPLYRLAADCLSRLHEKPLPEGMLPMDAPALAAMIEPAFSHYAPECSDLLPDAVTAFTEALQPVTEVQPVLALRDFHAENMVLLSGRHGDRQVGLLDFQDAFVTHPAYDLVSMLQDARRDLSDGVEEETLGYFITTTKTDDAAFRHAYAALGAQRNLRILGVFSRLAKARGKPQYLALQPRVWRHVWQNLQHPALHRLRDVLGSLPAPETGET